MEWPRSSPSLYLRSLISSCFTGEFIPAFARLIGGLWANDPPRRTAGLMAPYRAAQRP